MESNNKDKIESMLDAYKKYLESQGHKESSLSIHNYEENYKRDIAKKGAEALDSDNWTEAEIGTGTIRDHAIKAVQKHINLIGKKDYMSTII